MPPPLGATTTKRQTIMGGVGILFLGARAHLWEMHLRLLLAATMTMPREVMAGVGIQLLVSPAHHWEVKGNQPPIAVLTMQRAITAGVGTQLLGFPVLRLNANSCRRDVSLQSKLAMGG